MPGKADPRTGTASLDRGLALLSALLVDGSTGALDNAAESLGLPQSTARRLAGALARHGFLQRVERGRFAASPWLLACGTAAFQQTQLVRVARPHMRRLSQRLNMTVHLGILEREMITYLVKESPSEEALFTQEGMQLEAYCTAIGKMMLASLPDAERERYLADGPFIALTPATLTDPESLRAHLHKIGQAGFAVEQGETCEGLSCLAVPVRLKTDEIIAALSASATALGRGRRQARLREHLEAGARAIGEALSM